MESKKVLCSSSSSSSQDPEVRKGPWTLEEDMILMNYIANHGEGVWNSLAKQAGLKRTGKSCRLRWLNYLRPDVRRGNITPEEQLLIMELHSKWGNRWSKIAKHLPGRTDNEIKNFWRTRIQKHMKPPPVESSSLSGQSQSSGSSSQMNDHHNHHHHHHHPVVVAASNMGATGPAVQTHLLQPYDHHVNHHHHMVPLQPPNNIHPPDCNENNYWNMEDFWSMQLLNGD